MLIAFIVLAALGFVACIGGAIWWVLRSGPLRVRSGPEVGAEVMADIFDAGEDENQVEVALASAQTFKGAGIKAEGSAEIGIGNMKQQLRAGRWREILPPLIAAAGLVVTILFGSLAFLAGMEDKLLGGIIAAVGVYAVVRLIYNFIKA